MSTLYSVRACQEKIDHANDNALKNQGALYYNFKRLSYINAFLLRLKSPYLYLIDHHRSRRESLDQLAIELLKPGIEAKAKDLFIFLYVF